MTGFVPAKSLVRRESLVANRTLVRKIQSWWLGWCRGGGSGFFGGCGSGAATSKHDKAQSEVFFLGRRGLTTRSLRAFPLNPCFFIIKRSGCCRRVQSFKSHDLDSWY